MAEDVYYVALKAYIKEPNKKMIIWFLQLHFPYVSEKFNYINKIDRGLMPKLPYLKRSDKNVFVNKRNLSLLAKFFIDMLTKGYLCAGLPFKVCEYIHPNPSEIMEAYTANLSIVLYYVKKLTKILTGRIAITSDHGEAFGEPLNKLSHIRVYGHPSRVRIPSLIRVPYLMVENNVSRHEAIRIALRDLIRLSTPQRIKGDK